jgi:hypothetical protein
MFIPKLTTIAISFTGLLLTNVAIEVASTMLRKRGVQDHAERVANRTIKQTKFVARGATAVTRAAARCAWGLGKYGIARAGEAIRAHKYAGSTPHAA